MAGNAFLSVSLEAVPGPRFVGVAARARAPFGGPAGPAIAQAIRSGDGSVAEQFSSTSEMGFVATLPWPATQPFGRRPPPEKTLRRSGALNAAWLGLGAGSLTELSPMSVAVGVNTNVFPQAGVFQSDVPTVIRASKRGARGRLSMHWYLGMQFGAWISEEKLLSGLTISPRRVALNARILDRAADIVLDYLSEGKVGVTSAQGQRAA